MGKILPPGGRKERLLSEHRPVLIGLSGGLDSLVAAYLLKIQKRQIYAAVVAGTPEGFQEQGDGLFACHQSESRLKLIKKFCDHLQIPLAVLRPREEFQDAVLEPWHAARIELKRPRHCQNCHSFRLQALWRHMRELKCASLATGHFAKLVRSGPQNAVAIHSSNDLEADQSGLLSQLPQELLQVLELPLSELTRKEVVKIAENFELRPPQRELLFGQCLPLNESTKHWLRLNTPALFSPDVEVHFEDSLEAKHEGVVDLDFGALFPTKDPRPEKARIVAGYDPQRKVVELRHPDAQRDQALLISHCQWSEGVDLSSPLKGYLHQGSGLDDREVYVTPRTLGGALVRLSEGEGVFPIGSDLVVFRRRGKNAKVLVTGVVTELAREWPANVVMVESEDEDLSRQGLVALDKDFNF